MHLTTKISVIKATDEKTANLAYKVLPCSDKSVNKEKRLVCEEFCLDQLVSIEVWLQ